MKIILSITLFVFSLTYNLVNSITPSEANGNASISQRASSNNRAKRQTVTLGEQGLFFTLPTGWRRDAEATDASAGEFGWRGPDNTKFKVSISRYKPEYGNRSIEEETNRFYQGHKEGGSKDVRLLEIGGVRGVHYQNDDELFNERYEYIFWAAQYMYKGKRQILFVNLSSPASSFTRRRDALYGILHSIKFIQD